MLANAGSPFALEAQKAAAQVVLFLDAVMNAGVGEGLNAAALQAQLISNIVDLVKSGSALDLANPVTLAALVADVAGIEPDILDAAVATTAAGNTVIDAAGSLDDISDYQAAAGANSTPVVSGPLTGGAHVEGDAAFTLDLIAGASDADAGDVLGVTALTYSLNGGAFVSGLPAGMTLGGETDLLGGTIGAVDPSGLTLTGGLLTVAPTNAAYDYLAEGQ
jgi:hypothetical protein